MTKEDRSAFRKGELRLEVCECGAEVAVRLIRTRTLEDRYFGEGASGREWEREPHSCIQHLKKRINALEDRVRWMEPND